MKTRLFSLIVLAFLLTACNFSLAEDVTPPPNYVPPTPMPTLGPLYPAEAPNIENGAAIYAEKCAACHGDKGMGDGAQGKQLSVPVPALGLPQTARPASPAAWYTVVTRGNIQRFMPPFASLTDQERWDVVTYALSLQTTPEQIAHGQTVFESNCADCSLEFFKDQAEMSALSMDALVTLLKNGSDKVTAMKGTLSEDDLYAAAAYLRTLTFAASTPTPEPATVTPTVAASEITPSALTVESVTPGAAEAATPVAEGTPLATATSSTVTAEAVKGRVTGSISGENAAGLNVTLRGFDHASDASGPQETVTLESVTDANGNFAFDGLDMPEGRIYLAEVLYQEVTYSSEFAVVDAGMSELVIPPLKVYKTTNDLTALTVNQGHVLLDFSDGILQVIEFLSLTNSTTDTVVVPVSTDTMALAPVPEGMISLGYDVQQGQAMPVSAPGGFALPPSTQEYGMLAGYKMPYEKKADITIPFVLNVPSGTLLAPLGVKVKGDGLVDAGQQDFGNGTTYQVYTFSDVQPGDTLTVSISGAPKSSASTTTNSQQNLLIGAGALGLVLILAGVWMYLRDRNRPEEESEEEGEEEFDSEDEILDAIIALDDLHRAGKIPDDAYQQRRAELKARLKL